jgi:hypothetical protein
VTDPLQDLAERLEHTAERLRDGELDSEAAARLVEECAGLASDAASELDRRARAAEAPDAGGDQGSLL